MVTFKALAAAITQVEQLRDHEFTFEAGGMEITLRPLRSQEETEVQRYAQVAWEGVPEAGGADVAAYQEFIDRVRKATLGFSIVRLGSTDLHGVEYIDTGEQDDHGNLISMPKWEAIRDLISAEWSKPFLLQVFSKFGELLERVEISASKLMKFDPAELDEEIGRLTKRLEELKASRDKDREISPSDIQKAQKTVVNADRKQTQMRNDLRTVIESQADAERVQRATGADSLADEEDEPLAPPQTQQVPPAQGRRSAIPQLQDEAVPGEGMPQEKRREPPPPMTDEQGIELPHDGDSFFDPADPDAALEAEARRQSSLHQRNLQKQREKKQQQQRADELGIPTSADLARERLRAQQESGRPKATSLDVDPRTAGLREAANLNDQMVDAGAGRVRSGRPQPSAPQPVQGRGAPAQLHGKPVFKMPAQTLDRPERQRQHGEPPDSPIQINAPGGARNPKFRGPGEQ
jgi:hypothetical protein